MMNSVSFSFSGVAVTMVTVGAIVSTTHVKDAVVWFPTASCARTSIV